jgi:chemotaxis protein CheZ
MTKPRKLYRIEEMAAPQREPQSGDPQAPHHAEIMRELGALRALLAADPRQRAATAGAPQRNQVERFTSALRLIRSAIVGAEQEHVDGGSRLPTTQTARIGNELEAVMQGSEQATQKILAAAEEIDQAANNLSAALKGETENGLAQDIRDRVIQIFEACNFQDLTSQRVAKVMATLARIEHQITRSLNELTSETAPPLHGPRLDGDQGHASQRDVDSMFGGDAQSA